jgi:hypothetical protein
VEPEYVSPAGKFFITVQAADKNGYGPNIGNYKIVTSVGSYPGGGFADDGGTVSCPVNPAVADGGRSCGLVNGRSF